MEKLITWEKGFFSRTYKFYSNSIEIGFLKIGAWSNKAKGTINSKEYDFITKGFFKQETSIIDSKTTLIVGTIIYNKWKSKATIKLPDGVEYNWQYTNFWHTKWSLNKDLYFINYKGSGLKGEIVSYISDELIIMTGLFIANYYTQKRTAAATT
ncbi:MAG: hypothetical protein HXX16_17985 [Bacteroidales bacterium]|nr:hypothetical protein [Bacteroidales bacterium]